MQAKLTYKISSIIYNLYQSKLIDIEILQPFQHGIYLQLNFEAIAIV